MDAKPNTFILDVDGVLSTGQSFYDADGKVMKVFGPDDHDALKMVAKFMDVHFVTGDKTGFDISKKRVTDHMGFELSLVSALRRLAWIEKHYDLSKTVYMGDGIFDHLVMRAVAYSIAPANAHHATKIKAQFVTERAGGDRAVSEACVHLLDKFFGGYNLEIFMNTDTKFSGI